ncbi:MAG: hypothetical protein QW587_12065, partial [Candidatus Bathyarchaeia archaeon]
MDKVKYGMPRSTEAGHGMASVSKGKLLVGLIVGILIGAVVGYGSALSRIGPLETQVSTLQNQIASDTSTINSLNSQISHLQG